MRPHLRRREHNAHIATRERRSAQLRLSQWPYAALLDALQTRKAHRSTQLVHNAVRMDQQRPERRANHLTEDTDPFCRLPLAAFSRWPKALRLGDQLRIRIRSWVSQKRLHLVGCAQPTAFLKRVAY